MSDYEVKQEASVPVQSRIDVMTLATLVEYWEGNGVRVSSMSQLVSWSVDLLQELLSVNGKLEVVIDTVSDAHALLVGKRLYQSGMYRKSRKKISNALAFENLRHEGIDPRNYVPQQHSMVHNRHSVQPLDVERPVAREHREGVREATEMYPKVVAENEAKKKAKEEAEQQKRFAAVEEAMERAREEERKSEEVKGDDSIRPKTEKEMREMEDRLEKKDRDYEAKLRDM